MRYKNHNGVKSFADDRAKDSTNTLHSILKERGISWALTNEKEQCPWQELEDIYKAAYGCVPEGLHRNTVKRIIQMLGSETVVELVKIACSNPSFSKEKALQGFYAMCCESLLNEFKK